MKQIVFLSIHFLFLSCTNTIVAYESMNGSITQRIYHGENADAIIHSYAVQIRHRGGFVCAAFAISQLDLLLAAHCFDYIQPPYEDVTVHSGTLTSYELGNIHVIQQISIHPNYNGNRARALKHDIAHILLNAGSALAVGPNQRVVELPEEDVETGRPATMVGWGCTEDSNSAPSPHLKVLEMHLLHYTDCQSEVSQTLSKEHLCAIGNVGHGCPRGESGSLLVNGNVAIGIHSWCPQPGCIAGNVEVFTNLLHERAFIDKYKRPVVDEAQSSPETGGGNNSRRQSSTSKKRPGWLRKLTCTAK